MSRCLIGLGSNRGDRRDYMQKAVAALAAQPEIRIVAESRLVETRPIGGPPGQSGFLNAAALLDTTLSPHALLAVLARVERDLKRTRSTRWGPRTIDLDLLLFDEQVIDTPDLAVPHPRMAWRRFVLEPASEVVPDMVHPTIGWTVRHLLEHLESAPPYVAVTGGIGAGKSRLAQLVAGEILARLISEEADAAQLDAFYADPASQAWQTEIEFLSSRRRLLAGELFRDDRTAVSDFWFDQSLAFARVWLPPPQFAAFRDRFEQARREVVRPKLVVLLDVSANEMLARVRFRGRPYEQNLGVEQLDRLRRSVFDEAMRPGRGPVMRLENPTAEEARQEVVAAIGSMS